MECTVCGKSFSDKYKLARHMKVVHGAGIFRECKVCGFKVHGDLSHLKTHMATHTGKKRFACGLCPFKTIQAVNLKAHLKAVHKGAPLP